MARCISIYILLFVTSIPCALAQDTSILIISQADSYFSKTVAESINVKTNNNHSSVKTDRINLNLRPDSEFVSKYDLIITLGNKPAEYILKKKVKRPVLSLLITQRALHLLNKKYKPVHSWSTISLDQPIKRQFLLIKYLLGDNITVGTIFGPVSQRSQQEIIESANSIGTNLLYENTDITDQLISALKSLISKSDVLLAIPDPVAFNKKTIRGILLLTYRKNIPVIGFSQSYVKAGALAAIYSNPEQVSQQATEIIDAFINNGLTSANYKPKYFSIAINKKITRNLNIKKITGNELIELINNNESQE
jgi:ABC-type uncharacterized transport system substrate-binding protein